LIGNYKYKKNSYNSWRECSTKRWLGMASSIVCKWSSLRWKLD